MRKNSNAARKLQSERGTQPCPQEAPSEGKQSCLNQPEFERKHSLRQIRSERIQSQILREPPSGGDTAPPQGAPV